MNTKSGQEPWTALALFVVLQISATWIALALTPWQLCGIAIGVGDCQLATALLFAGSPQLSESKKAAGTICLIFSGVTLHYVAIVDLGYPFVGLEDYIVALVIFVAIGSPLLFYRFEREDDANLGGFRRFNFSLSDALVWIMAIGSSSRRRSVPSSEPISMGLLIPGKRCNLIIWSHATIHFAALCCY